MLFSSHVLSEVVAVSHRLLIINHGRLLADSPVSELRAGAEAGGTDLEAAVLDIVRSSMPRENVSA